MIKKGNKGEWSEIYVLLKLLGEGKVYSGDKDLKRIANLFYPIIKIIRDEQNEHLEYTINGNLVLVNGDGSLIAKIEMQEFLSHAGELLNIIKSSIGSFAAPHIQAFMDEIHCKSLKAKSQDKTDIKIVIHDLRTGMTPLLGFSIKSKLGGSSTLLNATEATNFIYSVEGEPFAKEEADEINAISSKCKIHDRVKAIEEKGRILKYASTQNAIFKNNLVLIDSLLPKIMADMLLKSYSEGETNVQKLVDNITSENPLNFDSSNNHPYYEHKVKQLLVDVALGMMPAKPWKGVYEANGGYLVVKEDGDVLCYHFYDRNLFEDYLYYNTKLDSASTSRYNFAQIYEENGKQYFKLNLQIRFY